MPILIYSMSTLIITIGGRSYFLMALGKSSLQWDASSKYCFRLILTFVALILMATGQPALFFLVPSTVGSLLLCAYVRKETNFFWNGPKLKESLN